MYNTWLSKIFANLLVSYNMWSQYKPYINSCHSVTLADMILFIFRGLRVDQIRRIVTQSWLITPGVTYISQLPFKFVHRFEMALLYDAITTQSLRSIIFSNIRYELPNNNHIFLPNKAIFSFCKGLQVGVVKLFWFIKLFLYFLSIAKQEYTAGS